MKGLKEIKQTHSQTEKEKSKLENGRKDKKYTARSETLWIKALGRGILLNLNHSNR